MWRAMRLFTIALALVFAAGSMAEAKGRKRRRAKKAKPVPMANETALAALRGPFKFGMSKNDVLKILSSQIKEKYAERISASNDVYVQDKLRRQQRKEIAKIRKSFVKFDGGKSGWEGAIIQDQFAHKTDESMMMYWETDAETGQDQRRFFFFHGGDLYKMFIALNSDSLKDEQRNFKFLRSVMERRFGPGKLSKYKTKKGETTTAISWRSKKYQASAIDNLQVFGSFCLVIADKPAAKRVSDARDALPKPEKRVRLIQGVVERDSEDFSPDESRDDVVDTLIKRK